MRSRRTATARIARIPNTIRNPTQMSPAPWTRIASSAQANASSPMKIANTPNTAPAATAIVPLSRLMAFRRDLGLGELDLLPDQVADPVGDLASPRWRGCLACRC